MRRPAPQMRTRTLKQPKPKPLLPARKRRPKRRPPRKRLWPSLQPRRNTRPKLKPKLKTLAQTKKKQKLKTKTAELLWQILTLKLKEIYTSNEHYCSIREGSARARRQ